MATAGIPPCIITHLQHRHLRRLKPGLRQLAGHLRERQYWLISRCYVYSHEDVAPCCKHARARENTIERPLREPSGGYVNITHTDRPQLSVGRGAAPNYQGLGLAERNAFRRRKEGSSYLVLLPCRCHLTLDSVPQHLWTAGAGAGFHANTNSVISGPCTEFS